MRRWSFYKLSAEGTNRLKVHPKPYLHRQVKSIFGCDWFLSSAKSLTPRDAFHLQLFYGNFLWFAVSCTSATRCFGPKITASSSSATCSPSTRPTLFASRTLSRKRVRNVLSFHVLYALAVLYKHWVAISTIWLRRHKSVASGLSSPMLQRNFRLSCRRKRFVFFSFCRKIEKNCLLFATIAPEQRNACDRELTTIHVWQSNWYFAAFSRVRQTP